MTVEAVRARPLTTEEVEQLLRAAAATIRAETEGMAEDLAAWHPGGTEWCVKECIGHIMEAEQRGFYGRINLILEEPGRPLKTWDQVEVQRARNDCEKPLDEVVDAFLEMRNRSVALVSTLRNVDLDKGGEHEVVGHLEVQDLLHEWVHHDRNHVRQLMANVQDLAWASMGNARRFADED